MLKNDVFDGADKITKGKFMEVRGESPDKNAFWRSVSQTAVEKFNMQEVFNMKSSVRLTAIEKLGKAGMGCSTLREYGSEVANLCSATCILLLAMVKEAVSQRV